MPRLQTDSTGFKYLPIPTEDVEAEEKAVKRKRSKFWNKLVKVSGKIRRRLEK